MDKICKALEIELTNLNRSYNLTMDQATNLIAGYHGRPASTHLGHNLGNVAAELSVYAAKIEETASILRFIKES